MDASGGAVLGRAVSVTMSQQDDSAEKSQEPTPRKLEKAREKGDIPRAPDLLTGFAYLGFLAACGLVGGAALTDFANAILPLIEQPDRLESMFFGGSATRVSGVVAQAALTPALPVLFLPAGFVVLVLLGTRGLTFANSKLVPKLSRISPVENAKNKYGPRGLFEFFKSFLKLTVYSACLFLFLAAWADEIIGLSRATPAKAVEFMLRLMVQFLSIVTVIAIAIGGLDYFWQRADHMRRNRMSMKELRDEAKDAEGDPHIKQQRRARAQDIAMNQMMSDVPDADVVIVNPVHVAIALKWSRLPGAAPVCVAKGKDHVATQIRQLAEENDVPIHRDPPTARALYETTQIGQEIAPDHYKPVAAAIRFAEAVRMKSRRGQS